MHSTSHLETGALEKVLKGSKDKTNKEVKDLLAFVQSRNHFKALTEHNTMSSSMVRME